MKTVVEIEWDFPEEQAWLCADNISIALHAYCRNTKFKVFELQSLRDELAELKEENEKQRMQLVACGVAALCNTEESAAKQRINKSDPYWCASYGDVCNAVDREMKLRKERDHALSELAACNALLNKLRDAAKDMWSRDSVLNRSILKVALDELDERKEEGKS